LNEEEAVLVEQLREGLKENNINPQVVLGGRTDPQQQQQYRELSKQEVIDVQEVLIGQLRQLL
jgi:methylmalonyl-CoA mutase cobalamin-binding subunit